MMKEREWKKIGDALQGMPWVQQTILFGLYYIGCGILEISMLLKLSVKKVTAYWRMGLFRISGSVGDACTQDTAGELLRLYYLTEEERYSSEIEGNTHDS